MFENDFLYLISDTSRLFLEYYLYGWHLNISLLLPEVAFLVLFTSLVVVYDTVSNQMTYNICYTVVSWCFIPLRQSITDFLPFSYHNYVQQLRGAPFSRPFPHYDDKGRDD